jgi:hypothetical protein
MPTNDSHYMKHLKEYYDKNTIKKVLNDKKVLGIQSYPHYVNAFIKNHEKEFNVDIQKSVEEAVLEIEKGWINMAFDDIFSGFGDENEGIETRLENTAKPGPSLNELQTALHTTATFAKAAAGAKELVNNLKSNTSPLSEIKSTPRTFFSRFLPAYSSSSRGDKPNAAPAKVEPPLNELQTALHTTATFAKAAADAKTLANGLKSKTSPAAAPAAAPAATTQVAADAKTLANSLKSKTSPKAATEAATEAAPAAAPAVEPAAEAAAEAEPAVEPEPVSETKEETETETEEEPKSAKEQEREFNKRMTGVFNSNHSVKHFFTDFLFQQSQ